MAGIEFDNAKWLASHGLGLYAQAFRDNHIEAEALSSLTMDDLREMGITSVGHRRKILAAIASLTEREIKPANLQAEPLDSERRQVTVLFADIARFSALSAEVDAEQVHALLTSFFEEVDRIIADFGGRIDKHMGDCTMAVFGALIAQDNDVRRAVASALAIHAAMEHVSEAVGRAIRAHVGIAHWADAVVLQGVYVTAQRHENQVHSVCCRLIGRHVHGRLCADRGSVSQVKTASSGRQRSAAACGRTSERRVWVTERRLLWRRSAVLYNSTCPEIATSSTTMPRYRTASLV